MEKYSTVDVQHKLGEMASAKKLSKLNEWLEKHLTLSCSLHQDNRVNIDSKITRFMTDHVLNPEDKFIGIETSN